MNAEEGIKRVLREVTGSETIDSDQELKGDIGLDSLSLVNVIVSLEDLFGIQFDDSDLDPEKITKVKDLEHLVENYI